MMMLRRLVHKPDRPDPRDYRYFPQHMSVADASYPRSADLRSQLPAAFDQGEEGSCGANAASGMMCFLTKSQQGYSRQQIYYSTRVIENDIANDDGVETRDLFKVLQKTGAALESVWPYTPTNLFTPPPSAVMVDAQANKTGAYARLTTNDDFTCCLAEGFPFIIGFMVYSSLMSDAVEKSGVMPIPNVTAEKLLGGHDVLVVGYDQDFTSSPAFKQSGLDPSQVGDSALLIRNSWGTDWGIQGHFWMPMSYASNPSTGGDAWTARLP